MDTRGDAGPSDDEPLAPSEEPTTASGPKRRRNPWIWVSAALALACVALLVWGLSIDSDLDSVQEQNAALEQQIDEGQATGEAAAADYKAAYQELEEQLGTTKSDLSETEEQLDQAQDASDEAEQAAKQAQQDADQAETELDKANAEADAARADAEAAEAKTDVAASCANAYVTEVGSLLESPDPASEVETAKQDLDGIVDDCRAALGTD